MPRTASPQRVSNVVFMGMGEPLANYDATWAAIERLHDDLGISARRITVSTVGVVPGIRRLARGAPPGDARGVAARGRPTTQRERARARSTAAIPIAEVLDAAAEFAGAKGRRVTFEYACIAGVNDSPAQAEALGRLLGAFPGAGGAHVNLIPLNPDRRVRRRTRPPAPSLRAFADRLRTHGVTRDRAPQPRHRHRRRVRPAALAGGDTPGGPPDRQQWAP